MVFHLEDGPWHSPYEQLLAEAEEAARALEGLGVEPADTVGVMGPNHPDWVRSALAIWLRGAVLVPIQIPLLVRDPGALTQQVEAIARTAGCRRVLADPRLLDVVPGRLGVAWDTLGSGGAAPEAPEGPGDVAVIQFTSGTTSSPKGAVLTQAAVLRAVDALVESHEITARDRMLAWLPLFHDWGLYSYVLAPILQGVEGHVIPTERFAADPALWFRTITDVGATVTGGPPSSWAASLRAMARDSARTDLSTLRVAVLAAEMIDPALVDRLLEVGGRVGLRPEAVLAAYGLAENVLTVSNTRPGSGIRIDPVDPAALARGLAEPATGEERKRVVSCGSPVPGARMRVVGGDGPVPDRVVGEVQVLSGSLMRGYMGGGPQPFDEGWLRTGDLGYLADGELFITGRIKDIVIVHGRNYAAEDVEWVAERVPGVRSGRCVAFSRPETEGEVVVVVEPSPDADRKELSRLVGEAVFDSLGISPRHVVVVPRGTVPKTTSGKLRRAAVRESYASGDLGEGD